MNSAALVDDMIRDTAEQASRAGYSPAEQEAAINGHLRVELIRALDALAASSSRSARQHMARLASEYPAAIVPRHKQMLANKGYSYSHASLVLNTAKVTLSRVLNGKREDPALLKKIEALPSLYS
jgi:hypothetical protein